MLDQLLIIIFSTSLIVNLLDHFYLEKHYKELSDKVRSPCCNIVFLSGVFLIANQINVEWALFVATVFVIVFKVADDYWFTPRRKESHTKNTYLEIAQEYFWFLIIFMLVRSFIIQPYRVPSGSLEPTIDTGDFILVKQYAYGIKMPISHNELVPVGKPQRGDIALFYYPKNPNYIYVKRVIGLPGDHVVYKNKVLMINGEVIPKKDLGWINNINQYGQTEEVKLYEENLEGIKHEIIIQPFTPDYRSVDMVVPKHQYFVMGDNRDNSNDSRFWGTVPETSFIGKAFLVWLSWDPHNWNIRWQRIGITF